MKKNKEKGFTLIEVLVTIAIIGIIFSISGHYIMKYIQTSKQQTITLNQNNILTSAKLYLTETPKDKIAKEVIYKENQIYIPINLLINKGYLKKETTIETNKNCVLITKNTKNNNITHEIITDCSNSQKKVVDIPTAKKYCKDQNYGTNEIPPTYNGTPQTITHLLEPGIGFTFSNNEQENAGSYKITATLEENSIWSDGSTKDKYITCSIQKANLDLSLAESGKDYTIGKHTIKIKNNSNISGIIKIKSSNPNYVTATPRNDILNALSARTIDINILATREENTILTIMVTPTNNNYKTTSITYTIGKSTNIKTPIPTCNNNLYYSNTPLEIITPNNAYTLENNIANGTGNYTVKAKLNYGYIWNDNSTQDKNITCNVIYKTNTITLDNQGATQDSNPSSLTATYGSTIPSITTIPKRIYTITYIANIPSNYEYTFGGFYTGKNGNGTKYIDETGKGLEIWNQQQDITLYAYWKKSTLPSNDYTPPSGYTITYWGNKTGEKIDLTKFHPIANTYIYAYINDITPPTCTISLNGTKGENDWYKSNVTVTYSCKDPNGSGCSKTSDKKIIEKEGTNLKTSTYTFYDNAGNSVACPQKTVKIDKTPPTCSQQITSGTIKTPTISDWYSTNVSIKYTCADTGNSNCKTSSATKTITTEGSNNITYTFYDNAGNSKTCSKTIKIDKTPPTITAAFNNKPASGYNNLTDVIVKDNVSKVFKTSRSSCNADGYDSQGCKYTKNYKTYTAVNRLSNYLKGTPLSGDNKSTETVCSTTDINIHAFKERFDSLKLSWKHLNLIIFAQDLAGNYSALLIDQYSNGTITTTNVTNNFTYYTDCRPRP